MQGRWRTLPGDLQQWRHALIDRLLDIEEDSVVFCHFVAINVAVGAATADDRLVCFRPDNGSITRIANQRRPAAPDRTRARKRDAGQLTGPRHEVRSSSG